MQYNHSLRNRISISFFLFSILLCSFIAAVVYYSLENIEEAIIEDSLANELLHFQKHPQPLDSVVHSSAYITRYYVNPDFPELLPEYLKVKPLGLSELILGGRDSYVLAAELEQGRLYIVKDITDFESREVALHTALIVICIIGPLIALWVGRVLSGQVISPVANLANQLAQMPVESRCSPRVASRYAQDEVGQLALMFDQYLERIEQFIAREQEFTGNASHELRTPLTIINGAVELLQENPNLPERAQSQVARIARAGQRMAQMVDVLLMLARNDADQSLTGQCQLRDVVEEVKEQYGFLLENKPIELQCQIAEATVEAPKALLAIALGNLLRNAMIYTEQGFVKIEGDENSLSVSDSGPGISVQEQQQIFQRHYRGLASQSGRGSGSGIGLSIVQRICERYQWQIAVDSQQGKGTRITLHFVTSPAK